MKLNYPIIDMSSNGVDTNALLLNCIIIIIVRKYIDVL